MDPVEVAGLVVVALLVGVTIPLLIQARASLRTWQRTMEDAGPRLNRALDEVTDVAGRIKKELTALDNAGERLASALNAVDDLSKAALELRHTAKVAAAVGAAVGPGIAAAVRAMKAPRKDVEHEEQLEEEE